MGRRSCYQCGKYGHIRRNCPQTECPKCGKTFDYYDDIEVNRNSLKFHMKTHLERTWVCPSNYYCVNDDRQFKTKADVFSHWEMGGCCQYDGRKQGLDEVYRWAKTNAQKYVNMPSKNRPDDVKDYPYRCPTCKDIFKLYSGAIRHQEDVH